MLANCRLGQGDVQFQELLAGVRRQLAAKGANQDVQVYVEDLLLERHQRQAQELSAEVQKRRALVEHCNRLEVSVVSVKVLPIGCFAMCFAALCHAEQKQLVPLCEGAVQY